MLTGGQKYRHNEDDYDGNDNDNKLLQYLILKLMILMIIMTIDSHNRYNLHIFARLVVIARSINTIEG
jgi:hypothetical protein